MVAADDVGAGRRTSKRRLSAARNFPGLAGLDLAKVVSVDSAYQWKRGHLANSARATAAATSRRSTAERPGQRRFRVVAFDYGVKRNILRLLADRGCQLTVLPATASAEEALAYDPDGIFLANGPGRSRRPAITPSKRRAR